MNIYYDIANITEPAVNSGQLYIYVLENYPQGNIKIGRTTNPKQRFISLSGSNNGGNKIRKVAISPVTYLYTLERICHDHFDKNRISNTEYFQDITFEEAVAFVDKLFHDKGYETCNNTRKSLYEKNPNTIPGFLIRESKGEK